MNATRTPYPSPLASLKSFLTSQRRPRRNLGSEARYSENPTCAPSCPAPRHSRIGVRARIIEACAAPGMRRLVSGVWQSLIGDARSRGRLRLRARYVHGSASAFAAQDWESLGSPATTARSWDPIRRHNSTKADEFSRPHSHPHRHQYALEGRRSMFYWRLRLRLRYRRGIWISLPLSPCFVMLLPATGACCQELVFAIEDV